MKINKSLLISFLFLCISAKTISAQSGYESFKMGEITAKGWIYNQMVRDMDSGNLSSLDKLRNLGEPFVPKNGRGYGEYEGNYIDAIIRNAIISGYEPFLEKAKDISDRILKGQDSFGFMGGKRPVDFKELHAKELSLWSQACFLRGLIAYAEYSDDPKYLSAVIRDVDYVMSLLSDKNNNFFCGESSLEGGARAHGLMFIDVLEHLHRITGAKKYYDFAVKLYEDFSAGTNIKNRDFQRSYLQDETLPFLFHAPHVAEHSRVVYYLNEHSSDYKDLSDRCIGKFIQALSPSGGLITDNHLLECVGGNFGDPDLRYEYCSITESAISLESYFNKTGDVRIADWVENIVFNAAQAARFPDGKACAYCSKDNQFEAVGDENNFTFRLQYAACHKIACCVFNQSRVMPYYVQNMWLKNKANDEILVAYYGPSSLSTKIKGTRLDIRQETMYPFENTIKFTVSPQNPLAMSLKFRVPTWCKQARVTLNGKPVAVDETLDFISMKRKWTKGDIVEIAFDAEPEMRMAHNNEYYFRYGALLFVMPFNGKLEITKSFLDCDFNNYNVVLENQSDISVYETLHLKKGLIHDFVSDKTLVKFNYSRDCNKRYPFDNAYSYLSVNMYKGKEVVPVKLVPIGSSVLRKTTFPH